jgi:2,3-bisphosphoglycerate-dependent phosphoglycerate mutase
MRNIYIVRHTEAEHHVQNLGGGWYDTPLTEKGKTQAQRIAENLFKEIGVRGLPVYSSDLKRCVETADAISKIFGSSVTLDRNLREMNFGECGGQTREWQKAHIVYPPRDGNRLDHRPFNGAESRRDVGTRAHNFMDGLLKHQDENVIVVTHGFFTSFIIMAWMEIPVEHMGYGEFQGKSGGVALLTENDSWRNRNVLYTSRMDFMEN